MTRTLLWLAVADGPSPCSYGPATATGWPGPTPAISTPPSSSASATDAREIATLRSAAPPESRRHRPAPPGLATRVADVVSKAGLPQSSLQNLSPETETSVGGTALRRQVAKVTLDGLALPELGRFLQEWRTAEPAWTVSSIDITPAPARGPWRAQPRRRTARSGPSSASRPFSGPSQPPPPPHHPHHGREPLMRAVVPHWCSPALTLSGCASHKPASPYTVEPRRARSPARQTSSTSAPAI